MCQQQAKKPIWELGETKYKDQLQACNFIVLDNKFDKKRKLLPYKKTREESSSPHSVWGSAWH